MKIHRKVKMFLAGSCAVAASSPVVAQNSGASNPNAQPSSVQTQGDQNEIIITAQKRSQRLIDVPQSVSVISGDSLDNQHAERLSDYLTRIPSANVVESQAGNARIVLRGINTGGVGATVATYIDETPFGSATSLANGAILAPDLDPFDLARVEVLRGPQGTLYGANSLGGLVKYVTVAPDPRAFDAAAERASRMFPMATSAGGLALQATFQCRRMRHFEQLGSTVAIRATSTIRQRAATSTTA